MKKNSKRQCYKMVQLFLTIFMIVTYALAAAILTYVSICSIEDSRINSNLTQLLNPLRSKTKMETQILRIRFMI